MLARFCLTILTVGLLVAMPAAALPTNPLTSPTSGPATSALPTPGLNCETTNMIPERGRYFPEPLETNDYIGYFEAVRCLEILHEEYPDRVELFKLGKSFGWLNSAGQREPNDVLHVEVTNEQSPVPFDERIQLFFMCSIHGNEKGGREGCLRVIEDFAKGIGMADADRIGLLDYMVLVFNFPNTDGWSHDEPEYYPYNPGTFYTRQNGNGTDLNRNWPTMGFMEQSGNHRTLAEPESAATANFAQERYNNVWYASDIHGMLNPADFTSHGTPSSPPEGCQPPATDQCQEYLSELAGWAPRDDKGHFLLSLLPAGQLTQTEQLRMTRLSELIRERLNDACGGGPLSQTWCLSPSTGAWGGNYNHWGTVWETIGYQVSGGSHDWMLSDHGLNAPSVSFEMSYNHIVCDGVYPGCGKYMNDFHVNTVRTLVATFMDAARTDFQVSIESGGKTTAYLYNPLIVTNVVNGERQPSGGWSDENPRDDRWDVLHNDYEASPNDFLRDVAQYVINGDRPGVFEEMSANQITVDRLSSFDNFVVAGSAYKQLGAEQKEAIGAWVEAGGNLVLTDEALQLAGDIGAVDPGAISTMNQYVGYTEVLDYSHPLAKDLLGFSQQTFEPVPIGYQQGQSPIWIIRTDAVQSNNGKSVGVVAPGNQRLDESPNTNLGELTLGSGTIRFLGALLPDPTYELYTPYGVASYAVTYAGNQYFVNLLGFDNVFKAPPLVLEDTGNLRKANSLAPGGPRGNGTLDIGDDGGRSPALGAFLAAAAVGAAALVMRRRRDDVL